MSRIIPMQYHLIYSYTEFEQWTISYANQYNIQAAGKDDHVNANQLDDIVGAGGTRNDLKRTPGHAVSFFGIIINIGLPWCASTDRHRHRPILVKCWFSSSNSYKYLFPISSINGASNHQVIYLTRRPCCRRGPARDAGHLYTKFET